MDNNQFKQLEKDISDIINPQPLNEGDGKEQRMAEAQEVFAKKIMKTREDIQIAFYKAQPWLEKKTKTKVINVLRKTNELQADLMDYVKKIKKG